MTDCLLGVTSFLTIALGGLAIGSLRPTVLWCIVLVPGLLLGLLTALLTRLTRELTVLEPLLVLLLAYLAYMLADLVRWSNIIRQRT